MLVYHDGDLVYNWVRVDWEAGDVGIEELLVKCVRVLLSCIIATHLIILIAGIAFYRADSRLMGIMGFRMMKTIWYVSTEMSPFDKTAYMDP